MRVRSVRISGFKSIPFCAQVEPAATGGRRGAVCITWARDAFQVDLPTTPQPGRPLLAAIIGPNSAGKSNILLALDYFFGSAVKLDSALFNGRQTDRPLIVEVTLEGALAHPTQWQTTHCRPHGGLYRLTLASVWSEEGRTRCLHRGDGVYLRQTQADRSQCERLLPELRVIWADRHLSDETRLERRSLLGDVLEAMLARVGPQPSIIGRIAELVDELEQVI
ncbi:MAG: ATP-binding protein, partial [Caldilineaceae bacterium]|nr:ATP-binding protein [Caldilineaceae bacterium]